MGLRSRIKLQNTNLLWLTLLLLVAMLALALPKANAYDSTPKAPAIDLQDIEDGQSTGDKFIYFYDSSRELSLQQALSSNLWEIAPDSRNNRGFTADAVWMKFRLKNSSNQIKNIVLEYADPAIKTLDIYYQFSNSSSFEQQNFTYSKPSKERPVSFYRPAFAIEIPANQTVEVVLRLFPGDDLPMHLFTEMFIWDEKPFYKSTHIELILLSVLLCIEIFMGIATLLMFFSTKDKVFLYYSIFAFSAASLFAAFSGLWPYFVATEKYELWMVVFQISICQIAAIVFVQYFLKTKKHMPVMHNLLTATILICVIGAILNLMGYPYISRVIIDFTAIGYFILIPIGIYSHKKGVPHSILFTSSWIVFIVGMVLASARLRGYIPDSFVAQWSIFYGGFVEIFLLASILFFRFRDLQKEKLEVERSYRLHLEEAAENLKKEVEEKTKQLQEAKRKAEKDARIDMLTQLTNRRAFTELASDYIARATKIQNTTLYLAMIDIDHFKSINDNFGHAAGDKVLKEIAHTFTSHVRNPDLVSRIGGEEFCIIIEAQNEQEALAFAERLRLSVEQMQVQYEDKTISVTISIGLSPWSIELSLDRLMSTADIALYKAKNNGRNQVQIK